MTYIDDLKYHNFLKDMDSHVSRVKITNFNIIHHECRGDRLENPEQYYKTIYDKNFDNYEDHIQNEAVSCAIKSERDDIYFERDFLNRHMKRDIEKI